MATISDKLKDEIFLKFTDVFPQFKAFSTYYKRLLVIWYFRLFVKCATICMILLLGICYYRNGVFNYSKDAGLYLVVLIICVFNSARQLRRDRRLEIYFLDASDAFEGMTEMLLKWCGANNPSFAKMLKLLLEEMNRDRNIELNTKYLLSLLIFDGIIWFANTTCLLVNMFNQFYFTVLIFFITTLVTIAMENLLVSMKNKPYKINENMTAEIDKICSIVNNYKEVTNDTDNSYCKTNPETTDITKENSGFTVDYFDFQKCCEEKVNLNKCLIIPPDSEQKNSANNNCENNLDTPNAENIWIGNEVGDVPQQLEPLKNSDDHNQSDALFQKGEKKSEHDSGAENICIGSEVDNVSHQFEILENDADDLNPAVTFLQEQGKKVDLDSKFDLHQNNNIAFVEEDNANNTCEHNFGALNSENIYTGNEVHNVPQQLEPLKNGYDLNPSDAVIQKQKEKTKHNFIAPNAENICTGNEVDNVPQQLEPLKNCEDQSPLNALSQNQEEKSEHYSIAPNAENICTGNEVGNVPQECEPFKNGDDLNRTDVLFQKEEEKNGHDSGVPNDENICMENEVDNVSQQLEPLENVVHDINPENTYLEGQKKKANLDTNFASTDNKNTASVEEESVNKNFVNNLDTPKAEIFFAGNEVDKITQQLGPLKNGDDLNPADVLFQKQEEKCEHDSAAPNAENICTGKEIHNVPQKLERLKNDSDDLNPAVTFLQEKGKKVFLDCKFVLSQIENIASVEEESAINDYEHKFSTPNAENTCTGNEVDYITQELEHLKKGDDRNLSDAIFQEQEDKSDHDSRAPSPEDIRALNEVYNVLQQFEELLHFPEQLLVLLQKREENSENDSGTPNAENICSGNEVDNVTQQREPLKKGDDRNPSDAIFQEQEDKSDHDSGAPNPEDIRALNEVYNVLQQFEELLHFPEQLLVLLQKWEENSENDSGTPNAEDICSVNEVDNVLQQREPLKNGDDLNPAGGHFQKQEENSENDSGTPNPEDICSGNEVDTVLQQREPLKNGDDLNFSYALFQKQAEKRTYDSGAPKVEDICVVNKVDNVPQELGPLKNGEYMSPSDVLSQKEEEKSEHYSIEPNAENICTGNEVDNVPPERESFKNGEDLSRADVLSQKQEEKNGHDSSVRKEENTCMEDEVDNVSQQLEPLENSVHDFNTANTFLQGRKQKVNLVTNFVSPGNKNTASVEEECANNNCVNSLDTPKSENIFAGNELDKIPKQLGPLKNGDDLNTADGLFEKQEENSENDTGAPKVEGICLVNEVDNVPQHLEPLKNGKDLNPTDALSQKQEEESEHYSIAPTAENICTRNEVDNVPPECEHFKNGADLRHADVLSQKQAEKNGHDSRVRKEENTCMEDDVDNVSQQLEPLENSVQDLNPGNTFLQGQKQKVNLVTNFVSPDKKNTASVEEECANNNCVNSLDTPKSKNVFAGNEVDKIPLQLGALKNGDDLNPANGLFQKQEENSENDTGAPNPEDTCSGNEVDNVPQQREPLKNGDVLSPSDALSQKQEEESEHYSIEPNAENIGTGNEVDNVPPECEPFKDGDDLNRADVLSQKQEEKNGHDSGVRKEENTCMENEVDNVSPQLEPLENSVHDLNPGNIFLQGQKQKVNLVTNFVSPDNKNTASVEEECANNNRVNSLDTPKSENIFAGNEVDKIPQQLGALKNGDDLNPANGLFQKQEENSENDTGAPNPEDTCSGNEVDNVPQQREPLKNGEDMSPSDALSQKQEEESEHYLIEPNGENICTGNEVDNVPLECEPFKNGDDLNRADVLSQKQEEKNGHDSGVRKEENTCMENEVDNVPTQLEPLENSVHDLNPGNIFLQGQKQKVNLITNFASTDDKNTACVEEECANNNCVYNLDTLKPENIFARNEVDKIPQQLGPLKNGDDLNPADVLFQKQEENSENDTGAPNPENTCSGNEVDSVTQQREPLKNGEDMIPSDALSQKQEEKSEHYSIELNAENICTGNEVDNVPQECEPFKNGDDLNRADVLSQKQEEQNEHDSSVRKEENTCMEDEVDNVSQQLEPLENSVHDLNPGNTFLQGQKQKVNLVTNFVSPDNKNTASVEEECANNNCVNSLDTPKSENIFAGNEVDEIPQQLGALKNGDDLNPADGLSQKQEENIENDTGAPNPEDTCSGNEVDNVTRQREPLKNGDDLNPSNALFQKQEEKWKHDSGAFNGENICIVNEDVNDTKGSKSLENYKNEENIKYDILSKNELAEVDILVKDKTCERNKNIQNSESDNNNSSADSVEKSCSSEIKNKDSYSDLLGNYSGLSNFSSNQKQKFNVNEESTFDSFVKPLDRHITVIQRKNINNSFEQLSGSKENYENFSNKEQENSARTENILNSDKKCEPYITAHKLETPFVSNIYKAYEQHSESVMAETREVKWAKNRNTGRDFFNEKELKYEARGSILENALDDNDALNNLLTPETHVTSPLMTLKNEAVQLLVTENSDKAEDVVSHTEPSTENASIRELSLGTENIPIKNTEFEDTKNMIERKFLINVSHQDEADATVSDSCGKLPSQITAFKNPEKESCHRLTPNEATSIKAKCDVSETDTKIPNVSEKNPNDTSSGCISRKSAGSTSERKYIASTLPYSDTADESGDDVHFVLKKHRPSDINRRKEAEQRKTKVCVENEFQMTNTMLHNTEQFSERKIALNYGKLAFCMDLHPESEIELVFKSSGKSMKRSTVYPFRGHK